jgi:hypothetical protein
MSPGAGTLRASRLPRCGSARVCVVGFDDLPMSAWVSPPLTTIVQPLAQMAAMATRTVLALLDGRSDGSSNRIELTTSLVVRASTAPPRGKAGTRRQARSQISLGDGHRPAHSAQGEPRDRRKRQSRPEP